MTDQVRETAIKFLPEIVDLTGETIKGWERHIIPARKREYELALAERCRDFMQTISKETEVYSNGGGNKIKVECRDVVASIERRSRRLALVDPPTQEEFVVTLFWMAEQGAAEDLDLVRQVKTRPPYFSEEIDRLLETAERRIIERVYDPACVLRQGEVGAPVLHARGPRGRSPGKRLQEAEDEPPVAFQADVWEVSWAAFRRALPRLLEEIPGQWVAYHGERQIAQGGSKFEVYRQLKQIGCPPNEVIVRRVEPLGPPIDLRQFRGLRTIGRIP